MLKGIRFVSVGDIEQHKKDVEEEKGGKRRPANEDEDSSKSRSSKSKSKSDKKKDRKSSKSKHRDKDKRKEKKREKTRKSKKREDSSSSDASSASEASDDEQRAEAIARKAELDRQRREHEMWISPAVEARLSGSTPSQSSETAPAVFGPVLPTAQSEPSAPLQRDSWMLKPPPREGRRVDEREEQAKAAAEAEAEAERRVAERRAQLELNPELSSRQRESTTEKKPTGAGYDWLMRSLKRAKEQAEEQQRTVQEVIAERWGSYEDFMTKLREEEDAKRVHDSQRSRGRDRGRHSDRDRDRDRDRDCDRDGGRRAPATMMRMPSSSSSSSLRWSASKRDLDQQNLSSDTSLVADDLQPKSTTASTSTSVSTSASSTASTKPLRSEKRTEDDDSSDDATTNRDTEANRHHAEARDLLMSEQGKDYVRDMVDNYSMKNVDDEYDLVGGGEKKRKKKQQAQYEEKQKQRKLTEESKYQAAKASCMFCFGSEKNKKHLVLALGNKTCLMFPPFGPLVAGHCLIVPLDHKVSFNALDEEEQDEVRNFKKALISMFGAQKKELIFLETAIHLKHQRHAVLECLPVPIEVAEDAPMYFKKALTEEGSEWAQHKKIIDTRGGIGIHRAIPKGFPYFHVEFNLDGGFAHVVEEEHKFPHYFGKQVVAGIMDLPPNTYMKPQHLPFEGERKMILKFLELWKPYDWTRMLDGGHY